MGEDQMIELSKRRFLSGLVGLIAAPAVVKASSLMKIVPLSEAFPSTSHNRILTIDTITREAVRLWKNSNAFMQNIDAYSAEFAIDNAIGTALRIRLPSNDWRATA